MKVYRELFGGFEIFGIRNFWNQKETFFRNSVDFNPGLKYHSHIDQIHRYKLLHLKLLISLAV